VLKYLDQSGVSLCLPPAYSWTKKGRAKSHEVRTRWGKQGRINLIGTLCLEEEVESLQYRMLEGPCRSGEVLGYLRTPWPKKPRGRALESWWSWTTRRFTRPGRSGTRERDGRPRGSNCITCRRTLPAPENLIEGVWRRLKGFLMPRRYYDSLAELKQAVLSALRLLGAVEFQC
jgi:putative transposase